MERTTLTLEHIPDGAIITLTEGTNSIEMLLSKGQLDLLTNAADLDHPTNPDTRNLLTLLEFPS
jgi:hypothetical protein